MSATGGVMNGSGGGGGYKRSAPDGGPGARSSAPPGKRSGSGGTVGGAADEPMDDVIEDAIMAGNGMDDMPGEDEEFMPVSQALLHACPTAQCSGAAEMPHTQGNMR